MIMKQKIGFIGSGNMAKAMIGGLINNSSIGPQEIMVSSPRQQSIDEIVKQYQVIGTTSNCEVASAVEILVLATKPNLYPHIIDEIKNSIDYSTIVVSIAAGQSIEMIEKYFEKPIKLVRTMPNTPALVGEGMTAVMPNSQISEEDLLRVIEIFNSFGKCERISESLIDAVIAVSGSSPAYVYLFIEAMADAAVLQGMSRDMAYQFAAQSVLGAAKMVLKTNLHPGVLKDQVCSPGGTTIEAVTTLEKTGFRQSVIHAMEACADKSKRMN